MRHEAAADECFWGWDICGVERRSWHETSVAVPIQGSTVCDEDDDAHGEQKARIVSSSLATILWGEMCGSEIQRALVLETDVWRSCAFLLVDSLNLTRV